MRKPLVFEHRRLRSVGSIWWDSFVINSEVRRKILNPRAQPLKQTLNHNGLKWFGRALLMPTERLSQRTLRC